MPLTLTLTRPNPNPASSSEVCEALPLTCASSASSASHFGILDEHGDAKHGSETQRGVGREWSRMETNADGSGGDQWGDREMSEDREIHIYREISADGVKNGQGDGGDRLRKTVGRDRDDLYFWPHFASIGKLPSVVIPTGCRVLGFLRVFKGF